MITLDRKHKAPPCLAEEKRKELEGIVQNGNYRCGNVVELICDDFMNKCYLCEDDKPTTINVEHFKHHGGNPELKFDWSNLFFACGHCNKIKGSRFDDILDCTNKENDVENAIKYELEEFPKNYNPKFSVLKNDELTENTVTLLELIFNCDIRSDKGYVKNMYLESRNLRMKLKDDLCNFIFYLKYYKKDCFPEDKEEVLDVIKRNLFKNSPFVSFKRWIVKNCGYKELEQYFV